MAEKKKTKIFGFDEDVLLHLTEMYCKQEYEHISNSKMSTDPFWKSVHEGCEQFSKKDDLVELI
ncbi:MAG: hypothetical protein K2M17_02750 [Bacilli bacterium]|nr:hypothetical protein [Bacilli bacterium]